MTLEAAPPPSPQVIGVVGAPRSGSTILGAALAERTGGVHVGELHLLWDRLATNRLCGCGLEVRNCQFWQAVWSDVQAASGLSGPEEACELWGSVVRMRRAFFGRRAEADRERFSSLMQQAYRSVATHTGASVIVDSSKHPGYFATLAGSDVPISLVQLTRDPRALAFSWSRPKADPDQPGGQMKLRAPAVVAAEWIGLNTLGLLAGRRYSDFRRLRYEDLVANGVEEAGFGSVADLSPPGLSERSSSFNHTVAGNPLRMAALATDLRVDDRWVGGQDRSDRLVVTVITGPLLPLFGYRMSIRP